MGCMPGRRRQSHIVGDDMIIGNQVDQPRLVRGGVSSPIPNTVTSPTSQRRVSTSSLSHGSARLAGSIGWADSPGRPVDFDHGSGLAS